tara:strand:- start:1609 stop:1818 length:210 start_codon:yes stop_codon:yes gene_type:complete
MKPLGVYAKKPETKFGKLLKWWIWIFTALAVLEYAFFETEYFFYIWLISCAFLIFCLIFYNKKFLPTLY